MQQKVTLVVSTLTLLAGAVLYLSSIAGVFWPATPPTDIGLGATTLVFVLFGGLGLLLWKVRQNPT